MNKFLSILFIILLQVSTPTLHAGDPSNDSTDIEKQQNRIVVAWENFKAKFSNGCERSLQKASSTLIERKPWQIDEITEYKIQEIIDADFMQPDVKLFEIYLLIIDWRLKNMNPLSRFFAKTAFESSLKSSIYSKTLGRVFSAIAGPHYNLAFNRIALGNPTTEFFQNSNGNLEKIEGPTIATILTSAHETEHAYHR